MTENPTVEHPEIWRVFSGEDGKSRMEKLDVKMAPRGLNGLASAAFPATAVQVVYIPPDMEVRWHNARPGRSSSRSPARVSSRRVTARSSSCGRGS